MKKCIKGLQDQKGWEILHYISHCSILINHEIVDERISEKLSNSVDTKDTKRPRILTRFFAPKQSYEHQHCHGCSTHTQRWKCSAFSIMEMLYFLLTKVELFQDKQFKCWKGRQHWELSNLKGRKNFSSSRAMAKLV